MNDDIFKDQPLQKFARPLLIIFLATSAGVAVSLLLVWLSSTVSIDDMVSIGAKTNRYALLVSMGLLWCLTGTVLCLIVFKRLNRDALVTLFSVSVISLLYLSFMREHVNFGDYHVYIEAAKAINIGEPFPGRYLYPPLWASFLARIIAGFGEHAAILFCFTLNQLSIVGFFLLGTHFLSKCGLSKTASSLLLMLVMLINVPVLRNVVYVQVNFLLVVLVFSSVVIYRRSLFISALLLALATHLKVIPLVFVPVFLSRTNYRWPLYYGAICLALGGATLMLDGQSYYLDFFHNLEQWHAKELRSCSVHDFLLQTNIHLKTNWPVDILFNVVRLPLSLWLYTLSYLSIRRSTFSRSGNPQADRMINGLVPLLFLLVVVSPTVWVHHLVILIIPALFALIRLQDRASLLLWFIGYTLTFLMPAFDWYPWSYLRLVGWVALLVSLSKVILYPRNPPWAEGIDRLVCTIISKAHQDLTTVCQDGDAKISIENDK